MNEDMISVFLITKVVGIFDTPKARTRSRWDTMTMPTMALPFVSVANSERTDAIRLHGLHVSL